ncbi:nitroreductase family protein [Thermodesulfobacteriota bacterium]
MELMEAITGRSMYRGAFQARRVEEPVLRQILEAATWAPSGHNSQPWEFIVIDDPNIIEKIADLSSEAFDDFLKKSKDLKAWVRNWLRWLRWSQEELDKAGDGIYMSRMSETAWKRMSELESSDDLRAQLMEIFPLGRKPSKLITRSLCLIYTLLDTRKNIPDSSQGLMSLTSVGAAIQNMRLAAHASGLAAHELSPLYDLRETRKGISRLLEIPDHFRIVSAMRVGYPDAPVTHVRTHIRRPLEKIVHRNRF